MEINLNTTLKICLKRTKVVKNFNIIGCCDVLSMTSARALHVRFVNKKMSRFKAIACCIGKHTINRTCKNKNIYLYRSGFESKVRS